MPTLLRLATALRHDGKSTLVGRRHDTRASSRPACSVERSARALTAADRPPPRLRAEREQGITST